MQPRRQDIGTHPPPHRGAGDDAATAESPPRGCSPAPLPDSAGSWRGYGRSPAGPAPRDRPHRNALPPLRHRMWVSDRAASKRPASAPSACSIPHCRAPSSEVWASNSNNIAPATRAACTAAASSLVTLTTCSISSSKASRSRPHYVRRPPPLAAWRVQQSIVLYPEGCG